MLNEKPQGTQRKRESLAHLKQEKDKSGETTPKDVMVDKLDEFKTTVLNILKESEKNVDKVKKTMCEQNGNINNETENLERTKKKFWS